MLIIWAFSIKILWFVGSKCSTKKWTFSCWLFGCSLHQATVILCNNMQVMSLFTIFLAFVYPRRCKRRPLNYLWLTNISFQDGKELLVLCWSVVPNCIIACLLDIKIWKNRELQNMKVGGLLMDMDRNLVKIEFKVFQCCT